MNSLGSAVQVTVILLLACILVLLWRRSLVRAFPVFFTYILYGLLRTIACSITLSNPHVYFYVYWITAPLEVLLAILAVHESFRRVFRIFYMLWWVRFCFPAGIVAAIFYAAVSSYRSPPVHVSKAGAVIISTMTMAQFTILVVSLLFFGLVKVLRVPWRIHEYRIVVGFGLSAGVTAAAATIRSGFGTRFSFLSGMLPAVVYILVLVIWLTAVIYPLPVSTKPSEQEDIAQLREVVNQLRRDVEMIRSLLKKR